MRTGAATGALSKSIHTPLVLPHQHQFCFDGENLSRFLESTLREIESERALNDTLPLKFWIKFAVGVNEVTRGLERLTPNRGPTISSDEHFSMNGDGSKPPRVYLQAILLASDCNPRWLTKHLPALAASRNVPLILVKDRKRGSLRLGELIKMKTAIAIGIKAKGNAVDQLIKDVLVNHETDSIEA